MLFEFVISEKLALSGALKPYLMRGSSGIASTLNNYGARVAPPKKKKKSGRKLLSKMMETGESCDEENLCDWRFYDEVYKGSVKMDDVRVQDVLKDCLVTVFVGTPPHDAIDTLAQTFITAVASHKDNTSVSQPVHKKQTTAKRPLLLQISSVAKEKKED
ncbi:hypothetical protein Tco_1256812 [Tanacetum coccineum]